MNFRRTNTFDLLKLSLKNNSIWDIWTKLSSETIWQSQECITSRLIYVLLISQFRTENNRFELRFDTENNIISKNFLDIKILMIKTFLFSYLVHVKLDMTENQRRFRFDIQICELKFMILLWNMFECGWCGPWTSFLW